MALKPNKRLREQRRRRGWSQGDVVKHMYQAAIDHRLPIPEGLSNTYISKWELGYVQPNSHHIHLLCLAFDLPSDRLGLPGSAAPTLPRPVSSAPSMQEAQVPYADGRSVVLYVGSGDDNFVNLTLNRYELLGAVGGAAVQPSEILPDDDDMNRRAFLLWLSVAATNVALQPIEPDPSGDQDRTDGLRLFPYQPPLPDYLRLDKYAHANATLWAAFGAARSKMVVLPAVRDQIRVLTDGLQRSRGVEQHRQLCVTAGDLFQLAGEVYFDANRYTDAIQCYTIAIDASKEANAHDLWACAVIAKRMLPSTSTSSLTRCRCCQWQIAWPGTAMGR